MEMEMVQDTHSKEMADGMNETAGMDENRSKSESEPDMDKKEMAMAVNTKDSMAWVGNYQRLEYLGDSVMQLIVTHELYEAYPSFDESMLTMVRSALVKNLKLAKVQSPIPINGTIPTPILISLVRWQRALASTIGFSVVMNHLMRSRATSDVPMPSRPQLVLCT